MLPEYVETEVLNRLGRVIGIGAIFESRIDWFTQYSAMGNNWCPTCVGEMKMTGIKTHQIPFATISSHFSACL